MERCENCERTIGNLETPMIYDGHVVCRECWERLSQSAQAPNAPMPSEPTAPPAPTPQHEFCYFSEEGIHVTSWHVGSAKHMVRLDEVLSVRSESNLFGGMIVTVIDLLELSHRFKFRNTNNARRFIAALAQAKNGVTVEREQSSWFFWWSW